MEREGWDRSERVTYGKVSDILAPGTHNIGPQYRQRRIPDPPGILQVQYICHCAKLTWYDRCRSSDLDTNFMRAGIGNFRLDKFENFRSSGLCELDGAGHGASVKSG
jgi:hypothetical protein